MFKVVEDVKRTTEAENWQEKAAFGFGGPLHVLKKFFSSLSASDNSKSNVLKRMTPCTEVFEVVEDMNEGRGG